MHLTILMLMTLLGGDRAAETQRIRVAEAETLTVTTHAGTGPVVVIVPGIFGGGFGFRNVTAPLVEAGYRVYVIELLGFGSSSKPRKADYSFTAQSKRIGFALDSLGVDPDVMVCHGLGAPACYRYVAHSDRVRALVSVNGAPNDVARTHGVSTAIRFAPLLRLLGADRLMRGKLKRGLIDASADPTWVTDDVLSTYVQPYRGDLGATLNVLKRLGETQEAELLVNLLPTVRIPVDILIATGKQRLTDVEMATLRTIPNVQMTEVHAGQYMQEEKPEAVVQAIVNAVRRRGS
jgi:pimeloyl-ACP methyl ester carboxylesterase